MMNIPTNKEETDQVLFELLEGNLPKSEETFWYDYSLQNKEFARQLDLFKKAYMVDDQQLYPNHSKMLYRGSPFSVLTKSILATLAILLASSTVFYFYQKPENIAPKIIDKTTETVQTTISESKIKPAVQTTKPNSIEKTNKKAIEKLAETNVERKQETIIQAPKMIVDTVLTKEIVPVEIPKTVIEEPEKPTEQAGVEPVTPPKKESKTIVPKLKVRPSRKMKTTDFNY